MDSYPDFTSDWTWHCQASLCVGRRGRELIEHVHTHDHGDGQTYTHQHPHPACDHDWLAAKPHQHDNGVYHSHPHPEREV